MPRSDEEDRKDVLPEHETRPESGAGGGLTSTGMSAEDHGAVDEEVLEARGDDEPAIDPDEPPPAYRPPTG
jgi:hypothetical protein